MSGGSHADDPSGTLRPNSLDGTVPHGSTTLNEEGDQNEQNDLLRPDDRPRDVLSQKNSAPSDVPPVGEEDIGSILDLFNNALPTGDSNPLVGLSPLLIDGVAALPQLSQIMMSRRLRQKR